MFQPTGNYATSSSDQHWLYNGTEMELQTIAPSLFHSYVVMASHTWPDLISYHAGVL